MCTLAQIITKTHVRWGKFLPPPPLKKMPPNVNFNRMWSKDLRDYQSEYFQLLKTNFAVIVANLLMDLSHLHCEKQNLIEYSLRKGKYYFKWCTPSYTDKILLLPLLAVRFAKIMVAKMSQFPCKFH